MPYLLHIIATWCGQQFGMLCELSTETCKVSRPVFTFTKHEKPSQIARIMGPTRGPPGADRTHVGPMNLAIRAYT